MARQVKVMVSLTEEEAGKLDVFMAGSVYPRRTLGQGRYVAHRGHGLH